MIFRRMRMFKPCTVIFRRKKVPLILCLIFLPVLLKFILFLKSQSYTVEPKLFFPIATNSSLLYDSSTRVNCTAIFELRPSEIQKSLEIRKRRIYDLDDENVSVLTKDCESYRTLRQYNQKPFSKEELDFPIAYSMLVHKDAIVVERLFHTIYSPSNIYCIYYDLKSSLQFQKAMTNLASCFPNVFIASKLETVTYAHFSRLQADLTCLSDLLSSSVQWKYVINLCGQDLPLKSNYELVSELKKLHLNNMLETRRPTNFKKKRYMYHHKVMPSFRQDYMKNTNVMKSTPPPGIEMYIGSSYFVLSHAFIRYIFGSSLVGKFIEWSKDTYSPDEHFWATLVRIPGVPGEVPRSEGDITDLDSKTRLVKWSNYEGIRYPPCTGSYLRDICIYGAAELQWLLKSGYWFANKFDPKVDPVAVTCLIEKLEEQQKDLVCLSSGRL